MGAVATDDDDDDDVPPAPVRIMPESTTFFIQTCEERRLDPSYPASIGKLFGRPGLAWPPVPHNT